MAGGIEVEGVRELTRAIASANRELAKEFAKENRAIGQMVLAGLQPSPIAVGAGGGATPRAIASRNFVAIQAGFPGRKVPCSEWGPRFVPRDRPRPFFLGTALAMFDDIADRYMDGIERVLARVSAD